MPCTASLCRRGFSVLYLLLLNRSKIVSIRRRFFPLLSFMHAALHCCSNLREYTHRSVASSPDLTASFFSSHFGSRENTHRSVASSPDLTASFQERISCWTAQHRSYFSLRPHGPRPSRGPGLASHSNVS